MKNALDNFFSWLTDHDTHYNFHEKIKFQRHFFKNFFKIAACELRIQFQKTGHKQTTYKCLSLTPENHLRMG